MMHDMCNGEKKKKKNPTHRNYKFFTKSEM